jgi:hypothetical protein
VRQAVRKIIPELPADLRITFEASEQFYNNPLDAEDTAEQRANK